MRRIITNPVRWPLVGLALMLFAASAAGQVMNDREEAAHNRRWLERSWQEKRPAVAGAGTLYIDRTAVTPITCGCGRLESQAAGGDSVGPHPTLGGAQLRIVNLGPGPVLRLRGNGFILHGPCELVTSDFSPAIEVEGRASPPTGRHRFRDVVARDCDCLAIARGGYYDDAGKFVADENHADNTIAEGCETFNCDALFRSENQQAVNWVFRDCIVNQLGPTQRRFVVADLLRGGCLTLERLVIEEADCTIFRLGDYSPNNCRLVLRDGFLDRFLYPKTNLCLIEYAGPGGPASWRRWLVDVDLFTATQLKPIEQHELYRNLPADLPIDDFKVTLRHVKQGGKR